MAKGDKFRILERVPNLGHELDLAVLRQLEAAGADLTLPTHTIYFFHFPSEQAARTAAGEIERDGCRTEVHPIPLPWWKRLLSKPRWSCVADKMMVLQQQAVFDQTARFNELAARFGGVYGGFESAVTTGDAT